MDNLSSIIIIIDSVLIISLTIIRVILYKKLAKYKEELSKYSEENDKLTNENETIYEENRSLRAENETLLKEIKKLKTSNTYLCPDAHQIKLYTSPIVRLSTKYEVDLNTLEHYPEETMKCVEDHVAREMAKEIEPYMIRHEIFNAQHRTKVFYYEIGVADESNLRVRAERD